VNLADGQRAQLCEIVAVVAAEIVIERRFRGPEESGNGGYSCGVLANFVAPRAAEVTLRLPPPLERSLAVEVGDSEAVMRDGNAIVAEAKAIGDLELEVPAPLDVEEATAARDASPLWHAHPFPSCFVCGPERMAGDGLGVTCGPASGNRVVAAPWKVEDSLPGNDHAVAGEIVWAALDCPGGLAGLLVPGLGVTVLGRLAVSIDAEVERGTTCVAMGWPIERDGRKLHAGSALFDESGSLLAHARATWIELKR
jgi:hypothetical protein